MGSLFGFPLDTTADYAREWYNVNMRKISLFFRVSLLFVLFSVWPLAVAAQATLFLSPPSGAYKVGELFSVLVNVNTGGRDINAASAQINFDNQKLEITSAGFTRSIFSLWPEEPVYSNAAGTLRFSGGAPNPGFNGASGSILRITFKPKAQGSASVIFRSGSVLANDGLGTNILDSLKGGVFNIVAAVEKPAPAAPSAVPQTPVRFSEIEQPITAPIITDWPKELEEGSVIAIKGLAHPNSKILLFVQKGSADPVIEERFAGTDGRFSYSFSKTVTAGLYRVWAKNVTNEGLVSAASEIVTIEVTKPLFFRVGAIALNYASIILTLLALILLLLLVIFWIWRQIRKWQERQGIEIHEAERSLHEGFEKLQTGLRKYLRYLTSTKSVEGIRRKEEETEEDLEEELKDIEKGIEKEIEDIETTRAGRKHKHYGHEDYDRDHERR